MNRIICLLFFIFIFQCQTSKVNTPKEKVPILFQVSDEHKSFFVDLNKNDYSEAEISEIFQNRKELARTVC